MGRKRKINFESGDQEGEVQLIDPGGGGNFINQVEIVQEEDQLGLLLEVIQNYEFLYNAKSKSYKNRVKKEEAWREIANICNMGVEDCMRDWKNLRDRYTREKRAMTGNATSESKWFYFDKLSFYDTFSNPRKFRTRRHRLKLKTYEEGESSISYSASTSLACTAVNQTSLENSVTDELNESQQILNEENRIPNDANKEGSELFKDDFEHLLEVIQHYEWLYNAKSPLYKNDLKKEQAWREISKIVNLDVEKCKRNWKTLRDRYTNEKRKHSDAPTWYYFDKMSFYSEHTHPRKLYRKHGVPSSHFKAEDSGTSYSSSSPVCATSNQTSSLTTDDCDENIKCEATSRETEDLLSLPEYQESLETLQDSTPTIEIRKQDDKGLSEALHLMKKLAASIEKGSEQQPLPDNSVNRAFAEYVYARLEEMSPEETKNKRRAILLVLEEIKFK